MSVDVASSSSHLNTRKHKAVFSGTSRVLGQCFDEEATVSSEGNRVTWTAAGRRRLQVSSETPVVQVGWGLFEDGPGSPSLCILHRGSLDLHHLSGSYHSIPLPDELNSFSSLPCGIIITAEQGGSTPPLVLVHPLEPPLYVVFKGASSATSVAVHEEVIWSSTELPVVATYNKKEEMVTLWKVSIREAPYSVLGGDAERASSDASMLDGSPAAAKTPQSQPKSLRLPNGNLSPLAFEPAPAGKHSAFSGPVSPHERCCTLQMLLQHHVPQDAAPAEGHLVEDHSGNPLLCLFSPVSGVVLAASLDANCTRAVWAFSLEGIKSVAAVVGTRGGAVGAAAAGQMQKQQRDLLVLNRKDEMGLYVEDRQVTPLVLVKLEHGPFLQLRPPVCDGGDGPLLEPQPSGFQYAAGDRVTLLTHSGRSKRAIVIVLPVGETAQAALLALGRASVEQRWEGAWSGESSLEWDALAGTLIGPVPNSSSMSDGSAENWDDLINSEYHRKFTGAYSWAQPAPDDLEEATVQILGSPDERNLAALYGVYEDSKLNTLSRSLQPQLQRTLSSLATASGAEAYSDFFKREKENIPILPREAGGVESLHELLETVLSLKAVPKVDFAIGTRAAVVWACYLKIRGALVEALKEEDQSRVNAIFAKCGKEIVDCLVSHSWTVVDIDTLPCDVAVPIRQCIYACKHSPPPQWAPACYRMIGRHDIAMNLRRATGRNDLDRPFGAASKLQEADSPYNRHLLRSKPPPAAISPSWATLWDADGMEGINTPLTTVRFGGDSRLIDVRRLLASNAPVVLRTSEHMDDTGESAQWQQAKLQTLATRTMALAFGRGAFALRTHRALPTEPLCIPRLNLSAQIAERNNAVVNLDMTTALPAPGGGALADLTAWPEFHNGVAAGLRLAPGGDLTRTWIVYNRPIEPSYEHAGMLFGLGLTGHLGCLAMTDLYRYLSQEHDPTVIGVLLGMSAAKRCSMDPAISKMLFLHLPSRHPAGYPELEIAPLVQTAAIIGLGLLYQESGHQSIVDILIQEIGRSPGAQHSNGGSSGQQRTLQHGITRDCESYALAAGFAVGLITLGKGQKALAPTHSNLESQLTYYMLGGVQSGTVGRRSTLRHNYGCSSVDDSSFSGPMGLHIGDSLVQNSSSSRDSSARTSGAVAEELAAAQGAAQVILEGDLINLNVTSPAATIALGLMYLQTNDERVADLFHVPESNFELEFINPEHLCGRVMMRALVMWDSVEPAEAWVERQLPSILRTSISEILQRRTAKTDMQTVAQAHCYSIAGACLALGIRSAGTQDRAAAAVIRKYIEYFLRNKKDVPEPGSTTPSLLNRAVLESCLASAASALAIVMAGSGDLETFKLLRALRKRLATPLATNAPPPGIGTTPTTSLVYGSHMAVSMSLGFLFMGAGVFTFGRSPSAVASLVISLYPRLPTATNDNRYYLQALRHLYVLAAERRNVDVLDVESNEPASSVPVEIRFSSDIMSARNLVAPCLLPEPHLISSLHVEAKQYWTQAFASDATKITNVISSSRAMYIQRKLSSCPDINRSLGMGTFAGDAGAAGVLGAGIHCNPSIRGLAQTVCLPLSDVASEDFPSTVATLPTSLSAFCRGALHECCVHEPELLPTYLYLYSINKQLVSSGDVHGSLTASRFRLLSQFYALYPCENKTKGGEECENSVGEEPVLNPTALERWWQHAQRWLPATTWL